MSQASPRTQGYLDAFNAFIADTYRAVRGDTPDGLPVFEDGCRAANSYRGNAPVEPNRRVGGKPLPRLILLP
jgi:hypothetical protein